jgi:hypothetical protein
MLNPGTTLHEVFLRGFLTRGSSHDGAMSLWIGLEGLEAA